MAKRSDDDRRDAGKAFQRFEDFTRRLLKVSKKEIDRRLAEERAKRAKRDRRRKRASR